MLTGKVSFFLTLMEETFELPVVYKGQERCFPARILKRGYLLQFIVEIDGTAVIFEGDEEENYRAMLPAAQWEKPPRMDVQLLETIAQLLQAVTRQ